MPGVAGCGVGGCTIMPGWDTPIGACGCAGAVCGCVLVGTAPGVTTTPLAGAVWNWPG